MLAPWHTSYGMTKLWRNLNSCVTYGLYAGEPVPNNILQDSALIMIKCSHAYNQRYLDFKREADQSFANVNRLFDAAEADHSEVMEKVGARDYGMNSDK